VLSNKDYSDKQNAELKRVKFLKGNNYWVINHRKKGEFFLDHNISIISGIGKKIEKKLKAEGIYTVQALAGLSGKAVQVLAAKLETLLTTNILQTFCNLSKTSKDTNKPANLILDHRQADNP
jgi:nucleotidyltransferase/DNA polymerase involved in DNA repair